MDLAQQDKKCERCKKKKALENSRYCKECKKIVEKKKSDDDYYRRQSMDSYYRQRLSNYEDTAGLSGQALRDRLSNYEG